MTEPPLAPGHPRLRQAVIARWGSILGALPDGLEIVRDEEEPGLVEIALAGAQPRPPIRFGRVTVTVR